MLPAIAIAAYMYHYMLQLYQAYLLVADQERAEQGGRRFWVHPVNQSRDTLGVFSHLVQEIREYPEKHHEYFRMSKASFDHILTMIRDKITKQDTVMRKAIPADLKLALTLHYLASGEDFGNIHKHWRVGKSTATYIVYDVCTAIWEVMSPIYLRQPSTPEDWKEVAKGFLDNWNFPHCMGAIDGKHVYVQKPRGAGSQYWCYKGAHSINLMAIADSRYRFIMVDIGQYGSESDGGVWETSVFNRQVQQGIVTFPASDVVGDGNRELPYVFVADEAFPLKPYLLRPYPRNQLIGDSQKIYNYRLSRARRVIENAFGILSQRWQIMRKPIIGHTTNIEKMIAATTVLHNYLLVTNDRTYLPQGSVDTIFGRGEGAPGNWRGAADPLPQAPGTAVRNYTMAAARAREQFKEYCTAEGAVDWQYDHITRRINRL